MGMVNKQNKIHVMTESLSVSELLCLGLPIYSVAKVADLITGAQVAIQGGQHLIAVLL